MARLAAIALTIAATAALSGCNSGIYLRDGVVDGDTFYIPPQAAVDPDPVVQAWIRYSLARSLCQIELADENPARATSFECEHRGREQLAGAWIEYTEANPTLRDDYLDDLRFVYRAGLLPEYVAVNYARRSWTLPAGSRPAPLPPVAADRTSRPSPDHPTHWQLGVRPQEPGTRRAIAFPHYAGEMPTAKRYRCRAFRNVSKPTPEKPVNLIRRALAGLALCLVFASLASAQPWRDLDAEMYPTDVQYDPAIPTPEAFLGYPLGSAPVRHHEMVEYLREVARLSPRLTVETAGYSHERRPILFLVATSEANQRDIDGIRERHVALTEPSSR